MEKVLKAIENLDFVFAKSMPKIPHCYTVKDDKNKNDYETLFYYILNNGYVEKFYGKEYKYCDIGEYKYWIMSDDVKISKIINRKEIKK